MSAFDQPTKRPSVFVETSTIKFSTDSRTILRPRKATFMFGPKEYTIDAYDIVEVNPNDKITDSAFRAEIDLLVHIADLAAAGEIELLTHSDREYPRFLELRKICGANQGSSVNENQLIDAFHIWCAEEAGATYFLTCDLKLRNLIRNRTQNPLRLELVAPTELLAALGKPT